MIIVFVGMLVPVAVSAKSVADAKAEAAKPDIKKDPKSELKAKPDPKTDSKPKSDPKTESKPKVEVKSDGKLVSQEIDFTGMVEVSSVKKNEVQTVSVWTTFPVTGDDSPAKLLKYGNHMMKIKGVLVEKNGKVSLKIKSIVPIEDGLE